MRDCHEPMSDRHLSSVNADHHEVAATARRSAALGCAGILMVTMFAGGCSEEPRPVDPVDAGPVDAEPVDAGPSGFAVRGTATGVLGLARRLNLGDPPGAPEDIVLGVALELRQGSDVEEHLQLAQDGAFAFDTRLEDGASYSVVLLGLEVPCTLGNGTGVIAGADAVIELTCTGPSLESVTVSGIAPAVTLVPGTTDYVIDLPLLQSAVTLTATVAVPGDALAIAGAPVASGTPSAELLLHLGDNPVDIVVENALGWQRTHRLNLRRAAQLAQYAYGKASNTGAWDQFGTSVALSGDTLAVGARHEDGPAQQEDEDAYESGAVYVFRRTGMVWQQEAYLKASNTGEGDNFGISVALAGDTLAVGAWYEDSAAQGIDGNQDDDSAPGSGAVYVFRRTGTDWQQEAYVKASNTGADDYFGYSVALAGDTLAVGAWNEDSAAQGIDGNQEDDTAPDSGAVYVFRRTDTDWQQEAYVKASNTDAGDSFGVSVALSGDTLAVGAQLEDSAVYVFRRTGTDWQQEAYVKASNAGAGDSFGISVALSGDTLAVGAHRESSAARGVGGNQDDNFATESGAAYVFRRTGTNWQQEAYVKASNTDGYDNFGYSVALAGDTLAVGAAHESSAARGVGGNQDNDSAGNSGAVYVFRRTGAVWQQTAYVKASNTGASDRFGYNVALSGDTLAVGAIFESSEAQGVGGDQDNDSAFASGAVYIFH